MVYYVNTGVIMAYVIICVYLLKELMASRIHRALAVTIVIAVSSILILYMYPDPHLASVQYLAAPDSLLYVGFINVFAKSACWV